MKKSSALTKNASHEHLENKKDKLPERELFLWGKALDEKSASIRLRNFIISVVAKKSDRITSFVTKKSKRITSAVTEKSNRVASTVTEKRICVNSASRKSSVLERAKIVEKSRTIPPPFLTGGRPFCMIKKNTFPAGASRINRQKIGAA